MVLVDHFNTLSFIQRSFEFGFRGKAAQPLDQDLKPKYICYSRCSLFVLFIASQYGWWSSQCLAECPAMYFVFRYWWETNWKYKSTTQCCKLPYNHRSTPSWWWQSSLPTQFSSSVSSWWMMGGQKPCSCIEEAKAETETHFERDETNTHFQDTIPTHTRHYLQPYNPTHAAETSYY